MILQEEVISFWLPTRDQGEERFNTSCPPFTFSHSSRDTYSHSFHIFLSYTPPVHVDTCVGLKEKTATVDKRNKTLMEKRFEREGKERDGTKNCKRFLSSFL